MPADFPPDSFSSASGSNVPDNDTLAHPTLDYDRLEALQQRYEMIGDIRGRGQLMGIELVRDRHGKEPATEEGKAIGKYCFDRGLIFSIRRAGSVLRFVPPATTTDSQVDRAMDVLGDALESVAPRRHAG